MSETAELPIPTHPQKTSLFKRVTNSFTGRFFPKPTLVEPPVRKRGIQDGHTIPYSRLAYEGPPVPRRGFHDGQTQPIVPLGHAKATVQEAPPKLSRQERRVKKNAWHSEWKAGEGTDTSEKIKTSAPVVTPESAIPKPAVTAPVIELRQVSLPGVKERTRFYQGLRITKNDLPWLETAEVEVPLDLMTLNTSKGEQFLYADLIAGKRLDYALNQMNEKEKKSADEALFVQLSQLFQGGAIRGIEMVHNHRSRKPTYETGNQKGQRVYFIRLDDVHGIPVILRIAAGNKCTMRQIFSVISTETDRQIRKGGKL